MSPLVGVALLIAIVFLLANVVLYMTFFTAEETVSSTNVLGAGQFNLNIESGDREVVVRPQSVSDFDSNAQFVLHINDEEVLTWDGTDPIRVRCLYPGDHVWVTSENDDSSVIADEHYYDKVTDCDDFNSFPEKFQYAKVRTDDAGSWDQYAINERYAFGLAIDPNGDAVATDSNGDNDENVPKIPLSNKWHYVEVYDTKSVEGFEPPVFVAVMVDNVHWTDVPDPDSHSEVSEGTYYDWDDDPPFDVGRDSFEVVDGAVVTYDTSATEPTNDVFLVFKPGCDQSRFKIVAESAGYDNEIYFEDEKIVDNTNDIDTDKVYTASGVKCRGDTSWD